jgi:transposase
LEHDIQRLQIEARSSGFVPAAPESERPKQLTLIEARRQRCRQARYDRYQTVLDLTAKGYTQLAIAAQIGIDPETISRWTKAPGFPERRSRKDLPGRADVERQHYSSSRMAALLSRPTKNLSREQASTLDAFLRFCPRAAALRSFVARFRSMLRWRSSRRLSSWIDKAASSGFVSLAQFAKTMRRDIGAVQLAITTQWSNGPVEGHVNR